jgi:carboxyl-terminal processing protease
LSFRSSRAATLLLAVVPLLVSCGTARSTPSAAPVPADVPREPEAILPLPTFDSAWTIVARTHWDTTYNGVDWNALRDSLRPRAAAARSQQELRQVLQQMLGSLKQSHFSIIPQEVSDVAVGASTNPEASREGQVGLTTRWLDQEVVVTHVADGSPAAQAGVRPGWFLRRVGEDSITQRLRKLPDDLDPRRASLAAYGLAEGGLRGTPGSTVVAAFVDERGADRVLTMQRSATPGSSVKFGNLPPQLAHLDWERRVVAGKRIGVIRFNIWMPVLGREFDVAIDSLRDSDAIVLDIRGNFGGVAGMSMGFAGHFVDTVVPVGIMKTRAQDLKFAINPRRVSTANQRVTPFDGPLAIVVDELSISTSEIFAGGLQSLSRAHIVGSRTAGQALPAVAERLPNGDILYHAIANFVSPSGGRMEGDGVTPDLPVVTNRQALLAGNDPALDAALRWASTAPKPPRVTGPRITP